MALLSSGIAACFLILPGALSSQASESRWRNWVPWSAYWSDVEGWIREDWIGGPVLRQRMPLDATFQERGSFLKRAIEQWKECPPQRPVVVLAHSQGGLDVRYAKKKLQLDRIIGLVTVGTPHRGAALAHAARDLEEKKGALYSLLRVFGYDLSRAKFLFTLSPDFLAIHWDVLASSKDFFRAGYIEADCVGSNRCSLLLGLALSVSRWKIPDDQKNGGDGLVDLTSQSFGAKIGAVTLDHRSQVLSTGSGEPERARIAKWTVDYFRNTVPGPH